MGVMRLGGLASGLDVDGMVGTMRQIWRKPAVLLERQKEKLSTQMFAWRDVNTRLATLKDKLNALDSTTLFGGRSASISDTGVLTASAAASAAVGKYEVVVSQLATSRVYQSTLTTVSDPAGPTGYEGTVEVLNADGSVRGSFSIDATSGTSLNDMARVINDNSSTLKLQARVAATRTGEYHLVVEGQDIGWDNRFRLRDAAGAVMQSLGVIDGLGDDVAGAMVRDAANTEFTLNGLAYSRGSLSVNDALTGVTLNLAKPGTATLEVKENTQSPLDAIKGFVGQFNSAMEFIAEKTKYDAKTKTAGTLLGQSGITHLSGELRRRVLGDVSGLPTGMNSLLDIGIKTGADGKLVIDESKLTGLLKSDPSGVRDIFQKTTGGLVDSFGSWLDSQTRSDGILPGRAKALEKAMQTYESRVKYFDEVLLPKKEEQLRRQMTQLEKNLTLWQNQGAWLSSQIASLQ